MTATLHRPRDLGTALDLLAGLGDPMVFGGGTAVQILLKQGVLFASDLVDIAGVPGLADLVATPGGLRAGTMVTLRRMETDPLVHDRAPLLAQVYGRVANPRVRNTASVGGNIAHGDYRLDPPTALLVLDARVELSSAAGARHVPIREFFTGFQETTVRSGEMVTAIDVPTQPLGGAAFTKLSSLAANDWPVASAAVLVTATDAGDREIRIGLGALAPTPVYVAVALPATASDDDAVDAALAAVEPLIDPLPDVRGGVAHKRRLGRVAVADATRAAWHDTPHDLRGTPGEEAIDDRRPTFLRRHRRH